MFFFLLSRSISDQSIFTLRWLPQSQMLFIIQSFSDLIVILGWWSLFADDTFRQKTWANERKWYKYIFWDLLYENQSCQGRVIPRLRGNHYYVPWLCYLKSKNPNSKEACIRLYFYEWTNVTELILERWILLKRRFGGSCCWTQALHLSAISASLKS